MFGFLKKEGGVEKFVTFLRAHLGAALGVDFERILGSILEACWLPLGFKMQKS